MSTTKHTSFIPMSPELLPSQKLNEVITLPELPKGLGLLALYKTYESSNQRLL